MIAEAGSLTKAAKTLHISQPAMSAMLKKPVEELNAELFDKTSNRIYLNQTNETALVHVKNILRNVEQMYEGADAAKLLSERVYDLSITPEKIQSHGIESQPFLPDQVFLSVPSESTLVCLHTVSLEDIPKNEKNARHICITLPQKILI